MGRPSFVAGDWGTSRLRLYLCDALGNVLARGEGEGASVPDCASRYTAAVATWERSHGVLPAILAGMVGSTIGWREAPNRSCPTVPPDIVRAALRFQVGGRNIAILPGLSCVNPTGAPDVMRGEETQILGALSLRPELGLGQRLFCLPGTHSKWVTVDNGSIIQFQTALSGELFDVLRRHSVLARCSNEIGVNQAFMKGADIVLQNRNIDLLHLIFSTRAQVVTGALAAGEAASYLSGLIIGKDVATALSTFNVSNQIPLICAPSLAALYSKVLATYGVKAVTIDGDEAALAGLIRARKDVFDDYVVG